MASLNTRVITSHGFNSNIISCLNQLLTIWGACLKDKDAELTFMFISSHENAFKKLRK